MTWASWKFILSCGLWAMIVSAAQAQAPVPAFAPGSAPVPIARPVPAPLAHPADSPMGEAPVEAPRNVVYQVKLRDGSAIIGKFPAEARLKIAAKFGDVTVDLQEVTQIEPSEKEKQFTVTLAGGDRLTGTIEIGKLSLQTAWGEIPLQLEDLVSATAGQVAQRHVPVTRVLRDGRAITQMRGSIEFMPMASGHSDGFSGPTTYAPYATPEPIFYAPASAVPAPTLRPVSRD